MRARLDGGTALVLGAGGPVGYAFHAGALAALHDAIGWDVREAGLVVGTSAGAGVGALVRAGLSGSHLHARACGRPIDCADAHAIVSRVRRPDARAKSGARGWRPTAPQYLLHVARRPWAARPARLVAALLPPGRADLSVYADGLSSLFSGAWPDAPLWITAVRARDGAIVAFGRDDAPRTTVGHAVASSSAVPGVYTPVTIDGERYVDGGMASAVHVRLAVESLAVRTLVVSSPLSRMPGMRALLRAEIRHAERQGVDVIALEPGPETIRAMGWNPMDASRGTAVAEAAYRETFARFASAGRRALPPGQEN